MKMTLDIQQGDSFDNIPEQVLKNAFNAAITSEFAGQMLTHFRRSYLSSDRAGLTEGLNEALATIFATTGTNAYHIEFDLSASSTSQQVQAPSNPQTIVKFDSTSRPGLQHSVTIESGQPVACSCEGFQHRGSCKHVKSAGAIFGSIRGTSRV